ncbi:MAG: phospho-N-acetylmuramoyl-pentapeptide-transferase [Clostridia bacterium]|nr:phospho-N-acetylmuramoyl-pentapeptide-transferase [Clostridia bacterium]
MDSRSILLALVAFIVSFFLALLFAPVVISGAKKLKAGQPILSYVEQHAAKAGTPTFGGLIFLFPTLFTTLALTFTQGLTVGTIAALVMVSFAVLGFLDDFIKIRTKDNQGLRPYQKIVGQAAIAVIVAVYAFKTPSIGSGVYFPFFGREIDFGVWYIPFAVFLYLSLANCVNLTDGLDGLASGCSVVYLFTYAVVIVLTTLASGGSDGSLLLFDFALTGGLTAFLLFNTNKASIFMGDTGSLALGGASAAIALFSKQPFLVLFVGIMYVVSGISIIVQVSYFKLTHGKRVFLMAPYHHHLEKKGFGEAKICAIYSAVTLLMGILAIASTVVGVYGIR